MKKVKIEYIDIERLKEWENNPRINDEASKKLLKLIKYYGGFINPIIATSWRSSRQGVIFLINKFFK